MPISVIDLFAGPGGLGEGFASFRASNGTRPFQLAFSVEKEPYAHATLTLRAFLRHFDDEFPDEYYRYVRGECAREELFEAWPEQAESAKQETLGGPRELGDKGDDRIVWDAADLVAKNAKGPVVVIGGPPCQAYSNVGRSRNKGIEGYQASEDKRHFLYREYLEILRRVEPEIFVMENVRGLLSSKVDGRPIFPMMRKDLTHPAVACGKNAANTARYKICGLAPGTDSDDMFEGSTDNILLRSEEYGIPQTRHRVILVGIREDLNLPPPMLSKFLDAPVAGDMLRGMPELRSGLSDRKDSPENWHRVVAERADLVAWELGRAKLSDEAVVRAVEQAKRIESRGGRFVRSKAKPVQAKHLRDWIHDERLAGVANHNTRGHAHSDLGRYLFAAAWADLHGGKSPISTDYPSSLAPDHENWKSGDFSDRFKVQHWDRPSGTVVSHISKDGHYFIHPDPNQCRSLTVREAARLQTFPDNYFFEGPRTAQYVQVGNAVPPWLALQIAEVLAATLGH